MAQNKNLYSVLLVDDEEEVIQIIMEKTGWENMGFQVIGYAHNGVEALEIAEENQPDVVLTDIKMPYMDGLTMSRLLKEKYPNIRIIIFSGFDEFEYAKEAISIEVEQYLLKPVKAEEIEKVFLRIRKELDQEWDERRNIDKLQEYYMESLPILQENFYTMLIDGRIPEQEIESYIINYQISLDGPYYLVTVLHIGRNGAEAEMDPTLEAVSLKKFAEDHLDPQYRSRLSMYLGDVIVVSQLKDKENVPAYTDSMDEFCRLAQRAYDIHLTAGVGYLCDKISDLRLSYQGARDAISYRAIYGSSRAINIEEIGQKGQDRESWEDNAIQDILKLIRTGEKDDLKEQISKLVANLSKEGVSLQSYRIFILEFIAEIYRFGINNQIPMDEIFREEGNPTESTFRLESPEEIWTWIYRITGEMQNYLAVERKNATSSFVAKAIEYVEDNYSDQGISIETVCGQLGLSSAYFSTVFKKETGKTFISYLTDYRMDRAADLLLTTDDKTYIIAEETGYSDPNYFSYVFKKKYGVAPSRYRTGMLKDSEENKRANA